MNMADVWLTNGAPNPQQGNTELRGMDTARLIAARPSLIVITRFAGTNTFQLAPQTVRLEVVQNIRGVGEKRDALMATVEQYVVLIGFKDNPSVPNTDVLRSDQFFYNERMWEVAEFIDTVPGRLLASCVLTP